MWWCYLPTNHQTEGWVRSLSTGGFRWEPIRWYIFVLLYKTQIWNKEIKRPHDDVKEFDLTQNLIPGQIFMHKQRYSSTWWHGALKTAVSLDPHLNHISFSSCDIKMTDLSTERRRKMCRLRWCELTGISEEPGSQSLGKWFGCIYYIRVHCLVFGFLY